MEFNKRGFLESKHTKQLMQILSDARANDGIYDYWYEKDSNTRIVEFTIEEIKEELSKREHVPNKLESKQKRQLMAKQKR